MNVSEYIASGILEVYLLKELPAAEQAEVETMAERHVEVRDELTRIEAAYEALASQLLVSPRPGLRDEILANITGSTTETIDAKPNVARPSVARPNVARPNVARPNAARTSETQAPQGKQRRLLPWQLGLPLRCW